MARSLPIRPEQPPDDVTVVLRAGVMNAENVRRSATRTFQIYAVLGISVEGVIDTWFFVDHRHLRATLRYEMTQILDCGAHDSTR